MIFVMVMYGQWCFSTKKYLALCQHCKSSGSLRRMNDDRGDWPIGISRLSGGIVYPDRIMFISALLGA
jgi:hypothetical protein